MIVVYTYTEFCKQIMYKDDGSMCVNIKTPVVGHTKGMCNYRFMAGIHEVYFEVTFEHRKLIEKSGRDINRYMYYIYINHINNGNYE